MKLSFSLKNKEASLEADVERLVEKKMDKDETRPQKTCYQIKQEEKRKNAELKHKQQMTYLFILVGLMVFFVVIAIIASCLGI